MQTAFAAPFYSWSYRTLGVQSDNSVFITNVKNDDDIILYNYITLLLYYIKERIFFYYRKIIYERYIIDAWIDL